MQVIKVDERNFRLDSLDDFDRYQVVTKVYLLVEGKLELRDSSFTEDWSAERKREKAQEVLSGEYIVYAAFEQSRVVGLILLIPQLNAQRMIVNSFHVSTQMRRHGIGRQLFEAAKQEALLHGADALYISACSSKETIDFYTAMGCTISKNPIRECVEDEPFDIQLECALKKEGTERLF